MSGIRDKREIIPAERGTCQVLEIKERTYLHSRYILRSISTKREKDPVCSGDEIYDWDINYKIKRLQITLFGRSFFPNPLCKSAS